MQSLFVNNITALAHLQCRFDLFYLSQRISNCVYNKKRFSGLIIRKSNPKGTFLVFQSGKIIIVGCESSKNAQGLSKFIVKIISKIMNTKIQIKTFVITNMLGHAMLPFKINIPKLVDQTNAIKHDSYSGAIYFMKKPVKTVIIYPSGKITLLGGKQKKDIEQALQILEKDLIKFKKEEEIFEQIQSKKGKTKAKRRRKGIQKTLEYESQETTEEIL